MKTILALILVSFVAASFTRTAARDQVCSAQDAPKSTVAPIELDEVMPEPTVVELPEVVIVGHVSHAQPKKVEKVWVCGPMHENLVGGANRDCSWK